MTGSLPAYPGPTKELSVNYTGGGEPFAIANDIEDDLDPRDLYYLTRAMEDHTHGEGRGLPINRISTNIAPQVPGDLQVEGDAFKWWGSDSDLVFSAVNTARDQTVNGIKRFNQPWLLPRQASAPNAPGPGLAYVYLGPGDRLYLRAGNSAPSPVGTPSLIAPALTWYTTQQPGETQMQQLGLTAPTWTQAFRPNSNDQMSLTTSGPLTYGGPPITTVSTWTCRTGTGKVNFTLLAVVVPVGGSLAGGTPVAVAGVTVDAPNTNYSHQQATVTWNTGLPTPGDVIFLWLKRAEADEAAAGGRFAGNANVIGTSVVYG